MNVETQCKHELLNGLLSIFESGTFTDLTICTEREHYKVHRAMVCCQSDVLSRMCLSPFKEGQSQTIELLGDYADAVDCMIRYMYTLDYDPQIYQVASNHLPMDGAGERRTTAEAANTLNSSDRTADNGDSLAELTAPPAELPAPPAELPAPPDPDTEDTLVNGSVIEMTEDHQTHKSPSQLFDELKLHCRVYALSDKYVVKGLMTLAKEKFQEAIDRVDVDMCLFEIVEEVYSSTPDCDRTLRSIVVSKVYSEIQFWTLQAEFLQTLGGMSSFCVDLLQETVCEDLKLYEQAIADVQRPGYCSTCRAKLVTKCTVSRRKNIHLEKYCAKCDPWH